MKREASIERSEMLLVESVEQSETNSVRNFSNIGIKLELFGNNHNPSGISNGVKLQSYLLTG
jgi:hypothetical protein